MARHATPYLRNHGHEAQRIGKCPSSTGAINAVCNMAMNADDFNAGHECQSLCSMDTIAIYLPEHGRECHTCCRMAMHAITCTIWPYLPHPLHPGNECQSFAPWPWMPVLLQQGYGHHREFNTTSGARRSAAWILHISNDNTCLRVLTDSHGYHP